MTTRWSPFETWLLIVLLVFMTYVGGRLLRALVCAIRDHIASGGPSLLARWWRERNARRFGRELQDLRERGHALVFRNARDTAGKGGLPRDAA
jgi:hypothetical protein